MGTYLSDVKENADREAAVREPLAVEGVPVPAEGGR